MDANDLLALGLGLTAPGRVVGQSLDLAKRPSELRLEVEAARGERYPCPACGATCKALDFAEFSWRHLNFFQHHCLITRWAVLKGMETWRSEEQVAALEELKERGLATATAFRVKELLRWVRNADTRQGARWRASRFIEFAWELAGDSALLEPVRKALNTFKEHLPRILRRWDSLLSNARLEGLNGLFQVARSRARGYRNVTTFITMIYLIGAPIADLLNGGFPQ